MFPGHDVELRELAILRGWPTPVVAASDTNALIESAEGVPFSDWLLDAGIARHLILQCVAEHLATTFVAELPSRLTGEVLASLDGSLARRCRALPLGEQNGCAVVALEDPFDMESRELLRFALGNRVTIAVADPEKVRWLLRTHFGETNRPDASAGMPGGSAVIPDESSSAPMIEDAGEAVEFVDALLARSVREKVSDIHLEPFDGELRVRLRVDGGLRELPRAPLRLAPAVISRLKVLANLDIAERRVPQDGRIAHLIGGEPVDFRLSTLPALTGESVVLRVLDKGALELNLQTLGMPATIERSLRQAIGQPNGIIIVTGPTGSGKTTTLYSCLRELNTADTKTLTVEDPVEFAIDGIMQTSINASAGLDFATVLKAFLRQDPDIVMIGEIRDTETARVAMQAALTGHLVLTTLHTNDALGAFTRLVDMGIEPYLIAATVEAVLAQRLLRKVCTACAGVSCRGCSNGFAGRMGVFELVRMTDQLREAITERAPGSRLQEIAAEQGCEPLRSAALRAVASGETTAAEVARHL